MRQVKWSPKLGHEMACCTEGGVVLKWDIRRPTRPLLRINAHEKACSSISWHPDGTHLISAGRDSKLYVWDLGNTFADKRQKPKPHRLDTSPCLGRGLETQVCGRQRLRASELRRL